MKFKKLIIITAFCILPTLLFGQTADPFPPQHSQLRNDLGINAGTLSGFSSMISILSGMFVLPISGITGKNVDLKNHGCYGLHYYYQIKPWLQVGGKVAAESFSYLYFTDNSRQELESRQDFIFLNITPSVKFTYLNRPWVRLYSGIDVGLGLLVNSNDRTESSNDTAEEKSNPFYFAFNITPIGVSVGKKFFGLVETNIGTDSFVKVGIGARW